MAKLRAEDVADINVRELEEVEYSTEQFDRYDGEVPPVGTELNAYVRKMWWTRSSNDDAMLKILTVAADNEGDLEQYNGCPFWLNAALIGSAKFRWDPFLKNFGISLAAIKARKVTVEDKEDQNGAPITSIDGFRPGEEHDEAWCRIITDQEPYQGQMQPRIREWLPWDDEVEASANGDEPDDEPEDEADSDEYEDEYEDEPEEDEPEDEPEPPAASPPRGRRGAAQSARQSAAPARGTRTSTAASARPAASGSGRGRGTAAADGRGHATAAGRGKAATKSSRPARGRGRGGDNEPPF